MSHEAAFTRLTDLLRLALGAPNLEDSRQLVENALVRAERLAKAVTTAAVKRGRKGGLATAQRGPEYFKQGAPKRKTVAGGRPKKS
jgi:hypothetical protein